MSEIEGRRGPVEEVVWHDVECGDYAADLALWAELAREASGPVLELGAGTGRVALALAAAGIEVTALDRSPVLLEALAARASARGLEVSTVCGDAREVPGEDRFALVLAPMQFAHLLEGAAGRRRLFERCAAVLRPGGALALAILAAIPVVEPSAEPLVPDMREVGAWIFASQPIDVRQVPGGIEIERVRQLVSPAGDLVETPDAIHLDALSAAELEAEAAAAGFTPRERMAIPPTEDHVGSTVVVLEAAR